MGKGSVRSCLAWQDCSRVPYSLSPGPSQSTSSLQGHGSSWLWPLHAAFFRSRDTRLRPPHCMQLPRVQLWLSAPSEGCESQRGLHLHPGPEPTLSCPPDPKPHLQLFCGLDSYPVWPLLGWLPRARVPPLTACLLPLPRDGICWQIRQLFGITGVPGRFLLQGEARASSERVHSWRQRGRG